MEEQRREGGRDEREPRKGRGRLEGRAPHGLEPAGSSPWQPLELGRPSGRLGRLAQGSSEFQRVTHRDRQDRQDKRLRGKGRDNGSPFLM